MERRRQSLLDHFFAGQAAKCRVLGFEVFEVLFLEDRHHHFIDDVFGHVGPGHECGRNSEGLNIAGVAPIDAARNGRVAVIGVVLDQPVDFRAADLGDHGRAIGGSLLGIGRGVTDQPKIGVDLVVAQRLALLAGGPFCCGSQIAPPPAKRSFDDVPGSTRTGARIADIVPLALDVANVPDAAVLARNQRHRLGMNRKNASQILIGTVLAEILGAAVIGVILNVRLDHGKIQLAVPDVLNVEDRALRRFDIATYAMGFSGFVDQAADGAAGRIVDSVHPAGADGDEALLDTIGRTCRPYRQREQQRRTADHVMQ